MQRRVVGLLLALAGVSWLLSALHVTSLEYTSRQRGPLVAAASIDVPAPPATSEPIASAAPIVPFILLFESGSGSSWLIKELAAHPQLCVTMFEPIDNVSLTTVVDHAARLRWLELLWSPPLAAATSAWEAWRANVEDSSIFGQRPLVHTSLHSCTAASVAFGLKARLSRFLNHHQSVLGLRDLLARRNVRVLRLGRHNRIKQALTEYRRLRQGLGHFNAARDGAGAVGASDVEMAAFERSLREVERSHRLASKVLSELAPAQPVLNLTYEELLNTHGEALARVHRFLGVGPPRAAAAAYRKATPDRLCAAVSNYAALCRKYERGPYAQYLEDPCGARCTAKV